VAGHGEDASLCRGALRRRGADFRPCLYVEEALAQVNWETIALIFGMFSIVAALSESGFFEWLALGRRAEASLRRR